MRLVILLLGLVYLSSCAAPTIQATKLVSARSFEAAKLKQVAVLPFDGNDGKTFSTEIEGVLAGINVGEKQFFSLIDRAKLDQIINEMKLGQSALVNPDTAAKIGNIAGAKGIYTGTVTSSIINNSHYKEERTRCAYNVTKYDNKGNPYQTCGKYETYNVNCTKRHANFAFTPKLIEVETARIAYSNNISGESSSAACSDSQRPLASTTELLERAKKIAKDKFRHDVAPYYVNVKLNLMKSDDGIISDEAKKKFEQGIDYAKNNRMDRACELWGEVRILSPNAPSVLYDLGICAEITGDLDQSQELYKKCDKCLGEPNKDVSDALHRVANELKNRDKLKEQIR